MTYIYLTYIYLDSKKKKMIFIRGINNISFLRYEFRYFTTYI